VSCFSITAECAPQRSSKEILLTVGGEVKTVIHFTASDLATFERHKVQVRDHDQQVSSFEGVLLVDILQKVGLPLGKQLRGSALTIYLLVEAADGYRVLFALPELDPMFTDKMVLVADRRDGKPLSEREGPLRIVVPDEKRQARWIRQVKSITVRNATNDAAIGKSP
jgi:DMSO/TMAO reductase YedYZ molybdopterin-dependent catalytic subunit